MLPRLALLLTTTLVVVLFRRDARAAGKGGGALWIPLLWILIAGSRFVGGWISIFTGGSGGGLSDVSYEEGSLIDRVAFLALIAAGVLVLLYRRVKVWDVLRANIWLSVFLLYCFLAVFWSDFPFVAFKRFIKILGHPVMAIIVLTEPDPTAALRRLMKRAGIVLLGYSLLLIKYYPDIGRYFDQWTGQAVNRGVSPTKNELGYLCILFGLAFLWNLLGARRIEEAWARREEILLNVGFLGLVMWLVFKAQSATSFACIIGGAVIITLLGSRWVSKKYIGSYALLVVLVIAVSELFVDLRQVVIGALGRDSTLTDRTEVWGDVLRIAGNSFFGVGFESFWLGERLEILYAKWWWKPTQAHNGYIETYINLGWVGVLLLTLMILATFWQLRKQLLVLFELGRFQMTLLVVIVFYNITEATFKSVHPIWTIFHILALSGLASTRSSVATPKPADAPARPVVGARPRLTPAPIRVPVPARSTIAPPARQPSVPRMLVAPVGRRPGRRDD